MSANAIKWASLILAGLTFLGGLASAFYARPTRHELRLRNAKIERALDKLDDRLRSIEQRLSRIEGALQRR